MTVIKRDRSNSASDLVQAIHRLIPLLNQEGEGEAADALKQASDALARAKPGSDDLKNAVANIIDAFEGDHDLMVYTHARGQSGEWTVADELSNASARVLNLARRIR